MNCDLHIRLLALLLLIRARSFGLNTDGLLLLSFKLSIISDPFGALQSWNSQDEVPCSWNGVVCEIPGPGEGYFRVTGLSLPSFGLSGSIPSTIGVIEHLRELDLSNNSIEGEIPSTLFGASELRELDLSRNLMSGGLPESVGKLESLLVLNISGNSFSGPIPGGFNSVRALDVSSNLFDGLLPPDFGGAGIVYFNASFNRLSGGISPEFQARIPENATLDLSFNNLTGPIPGSDLFLRQNTAAFSGNPRLCGKPLGNICPVASPPDSPPAIAVIPKTKPAKPPPAGKPVRREKTGLKAGVIFGIVVGDVVGVVILALIIGYLYNNRMKKRKNRSTTKTEGFDWASSEKRNRLRSWGCRGRQKRPSGDESDETTSESDSADADISDGKIEASAAPSTAPSPTALVTVDGGKELDPEALLKASAYILGASGSSIVYKAVLEDGSTLAVRRVGENGLGRFADFENRIRVLAKLKHPNLVRVRGFSWGSEEKLIIYDFVPNGSLANARYRKSGSSPCHLPWDTRLRIARGVARGLGYIHDKKHVHGNLKPSNILLGLDMEPKISGFGLERVEPKPSGSGWNFGSMRSTTSKDSMQDLAGLSPSPSVIGVSPYYAPESLRTLKPSAKWDVFAFGVVLLELVTGKVVASEESGPGLAFGLSTPAEEVDKGKVLRMADVGIRGEMEGKEEALLGLVKLGYGCIASVPQRRPSMKEVVQALDRFPCSSQGNL